MLTSKSSLNFSGSSLSSSLSWLKMKKTVNLIPTHYCMIHIKFDADDNFADQSDFKVASVKYFKIFKTKL